MEVREKPHGCHMLKACTNQGTFVLDLNAILARELALERSMSSRKKGSASLCVCVCVCGGGYCFVEIKAHHKPLTQHGVTLERHASQ